MIAARRNSALSDALTLDESSRVLVFGTEGATDPAIYRSIVGRAPEDVTA
jgi:diaminopropionate ammonia-lyase